MVRLEDKEGLKQNGLVWLHVRNIVAPCPGGWPYRYDTELPFFRYGTGPAAKSFVFEPVLSLRALIYLTLSYIYRNGPRKKFNSD